jgi:hypothetical protein
MYPASGGARPTHRWACALDAKPANHGVIVTFGCSGWKGEATLLRAWEYAALGFCLVLASLALLRGLAGLFVARQAVAGAESGALVLAGIAGWIGVFMVVRGPG